MDRKTFENTKEGLIVRLKIIPNSSKNEFIFDGENLKIKITAQPIENKANKALIAFLAKHLKIAKSEIKIIKGELSKEKTLLIQRINQDFFENSVNY